MKDFKTKISLVIIVLCFTLNINAQEVPLNKKEIKANQNNNKNNAVLLDNLVNPVRIIDSVNETVVSIDLLSKRIEFKYKKTGSGLLLLSIEETSISDGDKYPTDFVEKGLNKEAIVNQKAKIFPSSDPLIAIKKLLNPILIKTIPKELDVNGSGKGLYWDDDDVYVGDIFEGYPKGIGKLFSFEDELIYQGEFDAYRGKNGQGKALLTDGDIWEGTFNMGSRKNGTSFKVYHTSPSNGKVTIGEGIWNAILYQKVGLWHFMNPDGSIEEIDFGESGSDFSPVYVKFAEPNTNVNSFDEATKSIRNHLNQAGLYFVDYKEFNINNEYQTVSSKYQMDSESTEYYFIILPKGSTQTPNMQFTNINNTANKIDMEPSLSTQYNEAFGYPVFSAAFQSGSNKDIFDIEVKGINTSKAILLVMGAKSSDINFEAAKCTHGFVKE